ncbi:non-homologous end-joining DNA ligase [Aequorivita capsosiphonis]|uniref:non-homologous end-joining DNA ligase n=1 Tax=Aequorivita capsosiphonis TaxID=487317 RepID=UPI00055174B3|nr:non-homologous end-joining DNA ligase [Aequorivita capsosiphonis]
MKKLKDILTEKNLAKLKKTDFPGFQQPMLATLTEDYFDDPQWIYERKLDGVRCLVLIENGKAKLFSRNENDMSQTYPELKDALEETKYPNLILDGEIVAFDGNTTSFSKLQNRMQLKDEEKIHDTSVKVYLYLFDILYCENFSLTDLPLKNRKKILKNTLEWHSPIRYSTHRNENGKEYLKTACDKGWEGLIAKDGTAAYVNSRSKKWLKFKCSKGQELVIGGFTEPQGERRGFGAMLVGYYEKGELFYAGKVGTGFDDAFLRKWRKIFDKIETKSSPFKNYNEKKDGKNHWIKPKYVGQFGFTEWTKTNKLRHPRFLGMRDDKDAKEVTKEK